MLKIDSWPHSLLLFQVRVTNNSAGLFLVFAKKGPEELKKRLLERVTVDPGMFKGPLPGYSEDYIELPFQRDILESSDYEHWWDEERIRRTIEERLAAFAQDQFPKVNSIVLESLEEYRSEEARAEDAEEVGCSA